MAELHELKRDFSIGDQVFVKKERHFVVPYEKLTITQKEHGDIWVVDIKGTVYIICKELMSPMSEHPSIVGWPDGTYVVVDKESEFMHVKYGNDSYYSDIQHPKIYINVNTFGWTQAMPVDPNLNIISYETWKRVEDMNPEYQKENWLDSMKAFGIDATFPAAKAYVDARRDRIANESMGQSNEIEPYETREGIVKFENTTGQDIKDGSVVSLGSELGTLVYTGIPNDCVIQTKKNNIIKQSRNKRKLLTFK